MRILPGDLVSATAGAILDDWIGPCERLRLGAWGCPPADTDTPKPPAGPYDDCDGDSNA